MTSITRGKIIRDDLALWDGKTATASRIDATGGTVTGLAINDYVDALQLFGGGTLRTVSTINSAMAFLGSTSASLMFSPGTWTIDADVTIPSNLTCIVAAGCVFEVSTGKTLTFSGPVLNQSTTWTSGSGTVLRSGGNAQLIAYPKTAAETSASASISDHQYPPGDIRRYGAATGTADNTTAIQTAINVMSYGGGRVYIPAHVGVRYRHASPLYCYYDDPKNTGFASGASRDGIISMEGDKCASRINVANGSYIGSILEYTGATGIGLDVYDSNGTEAKAFEMRHMSLIGATTGSLLQMKYVPQFSFIENVTCYNNANGTIWDLEDIWTSTIRNCWLVGDGSNGTGIKYDAVEAGGGLLRAEQVTVEGVDIAVDYGAAFDNTREYFIKGHEWVDCQSKDCRVGFRLRAGVGSIRFTNCWVEGLTNVATSHGFEITNMAGWMDLSGGAYVNPGLIEINGGTIAWTNTPAVDGGDALTGIWIGDDTATETSDGAGNIIIRGTVFGQVGNNSDAIRIHNSTKNGYRKIENCVFHSNGGQFIVLDDESQYGPIYVNNVSTVGLAVANWVEDTGGTDRSYWCAECDNIVPTLQTATTYDYSNATFMPKQLAVRNGGAGAGATITLPTSPQEHTFTIYKMEGTQTFTMTYGSLNINNAGASFTDATAHKALHCAYDAARGWLVL